MGTDSPPSIAVLADVGGSAFHVGDEAMLLANLRLLRQSAPEVELTVLGGDAGPSDIIDALAVADGALISGGGNLSASWPRLLDQRVLLLEEASRRGLPVVVGGQTIGPFLEDGQRARLAAALAGVAFAGMRELPSTALALDMGVDVARLVYQVDDAFGLDGTPPEDAALLALAESAFIAVTLDGSYAVDAALSELRSVASQIAVVACERSTPVVFVPHVGTLGEREGEDVVAGLRFQAMLRLAGVRCELAPVLAVDEAVWMARRATLTVSSRYHPLVFASAAGRHCFGLYRDEYTRAKVAGALAHVGAERWCLSAKEAENGKLTPALRDLRAGSAATAERAQVALTGIADRERRRGRRLLSALGLIDDVASAERGLVLGWPASDLALTIVGRMDHVGDLAAPSVGPGHAPDASLASGLVRPESLSDEQWDRFSRDGFLHLGRVLDGDAVARLTRRADDLAAGRVANEHVQMQLDTGGAYEELPEAVDAFDEPTTFYRKIQGLEMDDEFVSLVRHPCFFGVSRRIYGPHVPLSIFRAMIMNKPAGQGTTLPWHQDGGDVWALDREPLVTIWVALDPATTANGCMEAVRGSHRLGLLSDYGSTVSEEDAAVHCPPGRVVPLEVESGHAVLLHNWLIHRSGVNPSTTPRRAVTICYLDGRTRSTMTGDHLPLVDGTVDPAPHHYVAQLSADNAALRESTARGEEYAHSLEAALAASEAARGDAERYARSLEAEREQRAEVHSPVSAPEPAPAPAPPEPAPAPSPPAARGWRDRLKDMR